MKSECQICESHFCTKNGVLVKHGYKRPGDGYLHGECSGVGHAPFPATDALVPYRAMIATMHSNAFARQNALLAGVETHAVVRDEEANRLADRMVARSQREERDQLRTRVRDLFVGVSNSFHLAAAFRTMTWAATQKERWLRAELERVDARIARAAEQVAA